MGDVLLCHVCRDRVPLYEPKRCIHGVNGGACVGCGREASRLHCFGSHDDPPAAFRVMRSAYLTWAVPDRSDQDRYRDGWEHIFGHEALPR